MLNPYEELIREITEQGAKMKRAALTGPVERAAAPGLARLFGGVPATDLSDPPPTAPTSGREAMEPGSAMLADAAPAIEPNAYGAPPSPGGEPVRPGKLMRRKLAAMDTLGETAPPDGMAANWTGPRAGMQRDLTRREQLEQELAYAQQNRPEREKSFWNRLGSGIKAGLIQWSQNGQPGGLAGLLGSIGAGSIGFSASPGMQADYRQQQNVRSVWNRLGQENAMEAERAKAAKAGMEVQRADYDLRYDRAKPIIDSIRARGYAEPGELEKIAGFGIAMTDPNNPEYVERPIDGQLYTRRKNDPRYAANPTVPRSVGDTPLTTAITNADGQTVKLPLTPGEAARTIVGTSENRLRAQERADEAARDTEKFNAQQADKDADDQARYQESVGKGKAAVGASATRFKVVEARIGEIDAALANAETLPETRTALEKEKADLVKEAATLAGEATKAAGETTATPKPRSRQRLANPRSKGGRNNKVGTMDKYNEVMNRLRGVNR